MPRVFKRLDRTIFKYIKTIRGKLKPKDEIYKDDFQFKDWHFFLTFNRNAGIQPFFYIEITHPYAEDPSWTDLPSYNIEFRWYNPRISLHGIRSISLARDGAYPPITIFHRSEYKVEYNELCWFVKVMKKILDFSLHDFNVLSSKFTELMVKMI